MSGFGHSDAPSPGRCLPGNPSALSVLTPAFDCTSMDVTPVWRTPSLCWKASFWTGRYGEAGYPSVAEGVVISLLAKQDAGHPTRIRRRRVAANAQAELPFRVGKNLRDAAVFGREQVHSTPSFWLRWDTREPPAKHGAAT